MQNTVPENQRWMGVEGKGLLDILTVAWLSQPGCMTLDIVPSMAQRLIFISKRLSFSSFLASPSAEKPDVLRTVRAGTGRTRGSRGHRWWRFAAQLLWWMWFFQAFTLSLLLCQCYEASRSTFQRRWMSYPTFPRESMGEGSKPNSPKCAGPGFFLTFTSILPTGIKATTFSADWDPAAHGHQPRVLCSCCLQECLWY